MEFVPFEIAKKLKEKGFDWETTDIYEKNSLICRYEDYPKPHISEVLEWLRINKEVDLVIKPSFLYDDNLNRIREYNCDIFAPQLNKPYHTSYHNSYELAALVGIEYVLNNLI